MTVFAVAFWTLAAGLVGYVLGPALGSSLPWLWQQDLSVSF